MIKTDVTITFPYGQKIEKEIWGFNIEKIGPMYARAIFHSLVDNQCYNILEHNGTTEIEGVKVDRYVITDVYSENMGLYVEIKKDYNKKIYYFNIGFTSKNFNKLHKLYFILLNFDKLIDDDYNYHFRCIRDFCDSDKVNRPMFSFKKEIIKNFEIHFELDGDNDKLHENMKKISDPTQKGKSAYIKSGYCYQSGNRELTTGIVRTNSYDFTNEKDIDMNETYDNYYCNNIVDLAFEELSDIIVSSYDDDIKTHEYYLEQHNEYVEFSRKQNTQCCCNGDVKNG